MCIKWWYVTQTCNQTGKSYSEMYVPTQISESALLNQGPKHWVSETGLGVGVDVCLSSLSCGPRFDTEQGEKTPNCE